MTKLGFRIQSKHNTYKHILLDNILTTSLQTKEFPKKTSTMMWLFTYFSSTIPLPTACFFGLSNHRLCKPNLAHHEQICSVRRCETKRNKLAAFIPCKKGKGKRDFSPTTRTTSRISLSKKLQSAFIPKIRSESIEK